MRHPRLKPTGRDIFHHCYNRVCGDRYARPFGEREKAHFVRLMKKLNAYYTVEVVAFQVMSNHFHIILRSPADAPSTEETCRRYAAYYSNRRTLDPASPFCSEISARLRDISCFMHDLQHQFSSWYNRTRPVRRRGTLWAGRFKNTVLEVGLAVWDCWKYIEMNPVRAHMVSDPADYRFCSFGEWAGRGRHPFAGSVKRHLLPVFRGLLHTDTIDDVQRELRKEFARLTATEARADGAEIEAAIDKAGRPLTFCLCADRRVRYWVDGLVIGSQLFVTELMTKARGAAHMRKRRLARAADAVHETAQLCCYKQLRALGL